MNAPLPLYARTCATVANDAFDLTRIFEPEIAG